MNGSSLGHSDADFIAYLERTEKAAGVTGPLKLFRPPGGVAWPRQLRLAQERGYTCVPHILAAGRRRGLRFVSVGTLMSAARIPVPVPAAKATCG
jgi:hypothetical protein